MLIVIIPQIYIFIFDLQHLYVKNEAKNLNRVKLKFHLEQKMTQMILHKPLQTENGHPQKLRCPFFVEC